MRKKKPLKKARNMANDIIGGTVDAGKKSASIPKEDLKAKSDEHRPLAQANADGDIVVRPKHISIRVLESINKKFGCDAVARTLAECLEATKTVSIKGMPLETPDYKVRLETAKLIMQYQVGNPVTRQEIVTKNIDTMSTLQSKLAKSPALRRAVGNMLDNVEGKENTRTIDITTEEEAQKVLVEEAFEPRSKTEKVVVDGEVGRAAVDVLRNEGLDTSKNTLIYD